MKQSVHREAWRDGERSFAEGRQGVVTESLEMMLRLRCEYSESRNKNRCKRIKFYLLIKPFVS